jgi:hypothetical protein
MATPTALADQAPEGYAFTLLDDFEEEWLDWTPEIDISKQADSK